ncbi:MFS transporter [Psychrobacter sp. JCM 18900]|nr:MFS transporter [Psychrobacter sp. JCM 18900]
MDIEAHNWFDRYVCFFLQVYSIQAVLPVMMVDFAATEVQAGMIVGALC